MSNEGPQVATLVELLRLRAQDTPNKPAFTFLQDGETESATITFAELEQGAIKVAADLQAHTTPGDRVLLLFPTGLEYITSFFGCLFANLIAVPTYAPRNPAGLAKLHNLAEACQPRVALANADLYAHLGQAVKSFPGLANLRWINAGDTPAAPLASWKEPSFGGDSVAFLQFTSGSTSAPRGVVVTHHNLLSNQAMIDRAFAHPADGSLVSWLPLYHDMGLIGMIIHPLYRGSHCVLMPPMAFIQDPSRWLRAISRYRAVTSGGPNFAYQLCVDKISAAQRAELDLSSWELAFNGAEPIRAQTLDRFAATFAECGFREQALFPCYGLAEATLMVSAARRGAGYVSASFDRAALETMKSRVAEPDDGAHLTSSGHVDPDLKVVIVDPSSGTRCGDEQVGEVWLSGESIAQGYWGQPEATSETFQAKLPGEETTYLRTGDLGFLRDGQLYITSRLKDTLVIAGRNLYPQDIELTAEQCHPGVRAGGSAVFSVSVNGVEKLALALEIERRVLRDLDSEAIFARLRRAILDAHDLPVHAAALLKPGQLPKTSSGKVRRHAVKQQFLDDTLQPLAHWQEAADADNYVPAAVSEYAAGAIPPRSPLEASLAEIWREVLRVGSVGVHDHILEWGAQSLQATQICARISTNLGVELTVAELLEHPTIAKLALRIQQQLGETTAKRQMLPPLRAEQRQEPLPLAWSQERMWFIHQLQPESAAYNMTVGVRFRGPLDVSVLERALECLVQRHEALRTSFENVNGVPRQKIADHQACHLQEVDLRTIADSERESRLQALTTEQAQRPFNLATGPLFDFELYILSDEHHVLAANIHHTVCDAWSFGLLMDELAQLYQAYLEGREAPLPELTFQYADFACWQRAAFSGSALEQQMRYWQSKLAGVPVLSLPTDHPRPPVQTQRGGHVTIVPDPGLLERVRVFSRSHDVTPFMTVMAAFVVLLQRYSGQGDIAVGTSIANRQHVATEKLVGTFVNTLVMRSNLADNPTFVELLTRVRETALEAYTHQDLSFEQLVAELQPERDLSHSPLFQVMFNYLNVPSPDSRVGDTVFSVMDIDRQAAQFDLTLSIIDTRDIQRFALEYNADLFQEKTIARLLEQLQVVLIDAATHPETPVGDLKVLTEAERRDLIDARNQTVQEFPRTRTLHAAIARQAAHTPNAVAALFEDDAISYAELDQRSDQLAAYLQAKGARPGDLIGICLHRSLDMLIALLGILKTGAAYVPLDPAFPRDRLLYMLEDSAAPMLVSQSEVADWLHESADKPSLELICLDRDETAIAANGRKPHSALGVNGESLAYVIYTSGSTGRPKGVQVTHRAVMNFLTSMAREPGLRADDTLLSVTTLSFDIAVLELYLPLITGARVVIVGREIAYDARRLADRIDESGATVMQATPATWRMLLDNNWQGNPELKVLCGGEALPRELAARILDKVGSLWNMYGPTETTVWSAIGQIEDANEPISVGAPIANTQIYILDEQHQLVPTGAIGELWIGGDGLAKGYLNRPELTRERFLPNPFAKGPEAQLYGTGDLARYLTNGRIEVLGRKDFQVKVRGFRIELGEIESTLAELPGIQQAAVVAADDGSGIKRLVGYVVADPAQPEKPDTAELRRQLLQTLPDYMVPARLVFLDRLPLTPNGKIDRLALPDPLPLTRAHEEDYVAPRTPSEEVVSEIFAELLDIEKVGVRDNFFALGGHSLIATRVISQIRDKLEVDLPLRTLFEHPTAEELALSISELKAATLDAATLDALLADIEHLTEEEIKVLVQQDQDTMPR